MVTSRSFFTQLEVESCSSGNSNARPTSTLQLLSDRYQSSTRFLNTKCSSENLFIGTRSFSSQAGTKSSGEEDDPLEDGFSELETSVASKTVQENSADHAYGDELSSEPELSVEDANGEVEGPGDELDISDTETDTGKKSGGRLVSRKLFKAIMEAPSNSVHKVLTKWVEEGNELSRPVIAITMITMRKMRMFSKALQLLDWLKSNNYEFTERDYVSRLDLIAKVHGLQRAEDYIEQIPKSFRNEHAYRTLLANCVAQGSVNKSEKVFNQMKDLKLPMTSFACNQLLLLYKRFDRRKIADVLLLMEQENIKPTLFTYRILIDVKGQSNDITGMEKIVETMKAEGIDPDFATKCCLARYYAFAALQEKAAAVLTEMEGGNNVKENRWKYKYLLPLYAVVGKADDVERIWQTCESDPRLLECVAAIEAWGKLGRIEEAEAVFEMMVKKFNKLSSNHYIVLLRVYAEHKMLEKGKDVVKRMSNSNCYIGPLAWDALVKLYVNAGEVEKADSVLHKAAEQNQNRNKPLFSSYINIMDQYAKRGDVHNTEKMFHRMRKAGYVRRIRSFQSLLEAYINAKAPAYGLMDRMKADNLFPTKAMAAQLAQVDAFRKTAVSDLID